MATDNEFLRLIYLALANSSGGTGGAGMTASVKDGLDTSTDIETIKTQLGNLAVLTSTAQAIYDQANLIWSDNEAQTAAAIDSSADVDTIIARLDSLIAASGQVLPSAQFRQLDNSAGFLECIQRTNLQVSFLVPFGYAWELQAIKATVATNSNVGNRVLLMSFSTYGGPYYADYFSPHVQTASQLISYSYLPGVSAQSPAGTPHVVLPLPKMTLLENNVITFRVYSGFPTEGFSDGGIQLAVRQIPII